MYYVRSLLNFKVQTLDLRRVYRQTSLLPSH